MMFHAVPHLLDFDPHSGDYGLGFFGNALESGAYYVRDPALPIAHMPMPMSDIHGHGHGHGWCACVHACDTDMHRVRPSRLRRCATPRWASSATYATSRRKAARR